MDTLHKLAGVQDASDLHSSSAERPSQPQVIPEPPPIPESDTETHSPHLSQRGSRASLPLNRRPSHKSFNSSKSRNRSQNRGSSAVDLTDYPPTPHIPDTQQPRRSHESTAQRSVDTTGTTEDFEWGPSHPCFPHPNAHCAPDSEEAQSTRVIRVRRDWLAAGDLYPQYANLYPEILDPLVSDDDFRFLISNLNASLKAAFDPFATRSWVDSALGVLTGYLWDDLGLTGVKKAEKGIERLIEQWNKGKEREGKEVKLIQLRRTGFMSLDFVVPDPGIDAAAGEEPEEHDVTNGGGPAE